MPSFLPGPGELDPDEGLTVGLRWLLAQRGEPLVVLSRKGNLSNNRILEQTVKRHRISVVAPPRVHGSRWGGGSILVVWARERALLDVEDYLAQDANAVCVIGWADGDTTRGSPATTPGISEIPAPRWPAPICTPSS